MNEEVIEGDETTKAMLHNQDLVRLGMAGNLASYVLLDSDGNTKLGKNVDYNGAPAGYTEYPSENISYVSKHDNQTLWDNNAYKIAEGTSSADRARMQTVSLSTVMMGQGIPFIHMGSELLRSKSMQRDSYDSGDWFNRVRFDGSNNNWNVGLPREDKDGANWTLIKEIIADTSAMPDKTDIELTKQQFLELLTIRSSSDLFRLTTAAEVKNRVDFRNVGQDQIQGLIVMSIDDGKKAGSDLDKDIDAIVVVVNSTADQQDFVIEGTEGFVLHEVQQNSADITVQGAAFANSTFSVPALTTAVFVLPQDGAQGEGLPVDLSNKDVSSIPPYGETEVFVKGSMNSWSDNDDWKMTFIGNGVYQVSSLLDAGSYQFKFADTSWSAPDIGCGKADVASSSMTLGEEGGNCTIEIEEQGKYSFTLDASHEQSSDVEKAVVSVTKVADQAPFGDTSLYLRGTITTWDNPSENSNAKFTYSGNNIYTLNIDLAAGDFKMKIADATWSEPKANLGGTGAVVVGTPFTMVADQNSGDVAITLPTAGEYRFELDASSKGSPVLTVTAL